ncbi:MAG: FAD-dependent oxidoreductase, partial [Spirochaetia bacterium]|nr:FAD-dependent oxidoreductase [Spirochaetia bacterium]
MESLYTDVLVIGASASGVCAALAAARHGCDVILTEETSWVGGMLSAAGVSAFDGNHLLPSGLFGEFRKHLLQYYGSAQELATGWVSNTHFEPHVAHQILSSMLLEQESIRQYRGYKPVEILKKRDGDKESVVGAICSNSLQGTIRVEAVVTIFADEYGDCVSLSDLPWHTGLEGRTAFKEELGPEEPLMHPQDFTWTATVAVQQPIQFAQDALLWTQSGEFSQILGSPPISLDRFLSYGALPNQKAMINWPIRGNDYYGNYLDPSVDRELLWQKARKKTQRLVHLL